MWYLQDNSPLGYKETTLNSPSIYVTAKKILLVIKLFLCAFNFNESFVINETKEQARTEKKKSKPLRMSHPSRTPAGSSTLQRISR